MLPDHLFTVPLSSNNDNLAEAPPHLPPLVSSTIDAPPALDVSDGLRAFPPLRASLLDQSFPPPQLLLTRLPLTQPGCGRICLPHLNCCRYDQYHHHFHVFHDIEMANTSPCLLQ